MVFIAGMEEGVLPHRKSFDDPSEIEEERRLCYVGITRAGKRLYLLRSFRRSLFGSGSANPASRFIQDISPHLLTTKGLWGKENINSVAGVYTPSPIHSNDISDLKVGDHVFHSKFGNGIVMNCLPAKEDQIVTVAFEESGAKKLLLSLAHLEKIEKSDDFPLINY